MIETNKNMHEAYRNADFNGRLHLYLQFPELRNGFLAIDRAERQPLAADGARSAHPIGRRRGTFAQTLSRWICPQCG